MGPRYLTRAIEGHSCLYLSQTLPAPPLDSIFPSPDLPLIEHSRSEKEGLYTLVIPPPPPFYRWGNQGLYDPQYVRGKARVKKPSSLYLKTSLSLEQHPSPQTYSLPMTWCSQETSIFTLRFSSGPGANRPETAIPRDNGLCLKQTLGGDIGLWPLKLFYCQLGLENVIQHPLPSSRTTQERSLLVPERPPNTRMDFLPAKYRDQVPLPPSPPH